MAAYAALVSVMHTIDELLHHPHPPIFLHKQRLVPLTQNVTFFQDFLETYNGGDAQETDGLESRIADAALAADGIIESHIVDQILSGSTTREEKTSGVDIYDGLQEVIEDMDSIKELAMKLKQDPIQRNKMPARSSKHMDSIKEVAMKLKQDPIQRNKMPARSSKLPSTRESRLMVGFDGILCELMDKLIGEPPLRLIPLVGMGGIGKTTLARHVYSHETVVQRFDIRAWVTISQECILKEILLEILNGIEKDHNEELRDMNEHDLGDKLRKILFGRRYLIIMDDIWDIKIWEQLRLYFPDNNKGSRIVFTTRLSALAQDLSGSHGLFKLDFLNELDSWTLFCKIVFGEEGCPLNLEEIGKKIIESCRGLPLSIKVIGGHLSVSAQKPRYWEYIAENISSVVNLDDNEHCLKVLYTSYNNLPVHLKPCFLYMSVFKEDSKIHVSGLIKLWVAEGFLKPKDGRSLEDVAGEYLGELVDRNLILVEKRNYCGMLKLCKIHDLLRDLCLREARKHKFLSVLVETRSDDGKLKLERRSDDDGKLKLSKMYHLLRDLFSRKDRKKNFVSAASSSNSQDIDSERRIWSYDGRKLDPVSVAHALNLNHGKSKLPIFGGRLSYATDYLPRRHRESLLQHLLVVFQRVNLRFINLGRGPFDSDVLLSEFPSSIYLLWNLQTLVIDLPWENDDVTFEIWKMPRLRHVRVRKVFELTDPSTDDGFVLENLQTLLQVRNFKWSGEVVKRIPNIMKLKLYYSLAEERQWQSHDYYCLSNIGHLHKLTSLRIETENSFIGFLHMPHLTLPHSLKKLSLNRTGLPWEDMTKVVGSLPLLEHLQLVTDACLGSAWVTNEGQFCSLKVLEIYFSRFEYWETETEHFPRLERIVLHAILLKEIPSCIGDIDTLQSFTLHQCYRSAWDSAQKIKEEQEEFGNVTLQFDICSEDSTIDRIMMELENKDDRIMMRHENEDDGICSEDLTLDHMNENEDED